MQRQVGPRVSALHPAIDPAAFRRQSFPCHGFCRCPIRPCRSRRDVPFARKPLAQLIIRTSHIACQSVPSALLIPPQIVPRRRCRELESGPGPPVILFILRRGAGTTSGNRQQSCQEVGPKSDSEFQAHLHHSPSAAKLAMLPPYNNLVSL